MGEWHAVDRAKAANGYVRGRERDGCWQCVHAKPSSGKLYCDLLHTEVRKMDVCAKLFKHEHHAEKRT